MFGIINYIFHSTLADALCGNPACSLGEEGGMRPSIEIKIKLNENKLQ